MYVKTNVLIMALFFLFLGSSTLDARSPNPAQIWENALNAGDEDYIMKKKKRRSYKRSKSKTLSDEKKIQTSLVVLGFYNGAINGNVNGDKTRQAIKRMNQTYRNKDTTFLDSDVKETLFHLADLSQYRKNLLSTKNDKKTNTKRIQTSLKIFGYYDDKIDGLAGSGTRKSIVKYKTDNHYSQGSTFNFEEEYQLLSKAMNLNKKNIQETKEKLKLPLETSQLTVNSVDTPIQEIDVVSTFTDENTAEKQTVIVKEVEVNQEIVSLDTTTDSVLTQEECQTLVVSYDEAVLTGVVNDIADLESTANIIMYMCNIQTTKTGAIEQTLKQLKSK